jgi:hypothetical protein
MVMAKVVMPRWSSGRIPRAARSISKSSAGTSVITSASPRCSSARRAAGSRTMR